MKDYILVTCANLKHAELCLAALQHRFDLEPSSFRVQGTCVPTYHVRYTGIDDYAARAMFAQGFYAALKAHSTL